MKIKNKKNSRKNGVASSLFSKRKNLHVPLIILGVCVVVLILIAKYSSSVEPIQASIICTQTGFFRDGINMTAAKINPGKITGDVNATGCNIGVYYDTNGLVDKAIIHGANYFGVLVNGDIKNPSVDIFNSTIHDIGETPLNGTQHGLAIYYRGFGSGGPSGKIWNNTLSNYQKGGIVTNGSNTSVDIKGNTVTGQGPVNYIAQNGIQAGY